MPCHWSLCFLVSPCYLQDAMPCLWSSSDLPRVLRIWESIFYCQAFLSLHSFLLVLRLSWGWLFNLKVSRASCWSLKHSPGPTIVQITAIHKRGILVGSIYVPKASFEVRVPKPRNLPLTGFEPASLKVPVVSSCLSRRLGHRVSWVLIDG